MSWAEWGTARAEAGQVIHIPEVQLSMENWPEVKRGVATQTAVGFVRQEKAQGFLHQRQGPMQGLSE